MMLCCEEKAPYGPAEDTAKMFLQLLCMAHEHLLVSSPSNEKRGHDLKSISITVYLAQQEDYPSSRQEWDSFDGVLIPGSLSSAFDTHIPWIGRLHRVIREEIHANRLKTLAVCFGHQSFAHALGELEGSGGSEESSARCGEAVVCPSGKKAGRKHLSMTSAGSSLFAKTNTGASQTPCLEMLYTHGDMVASLPAMSLSLGGNNDVPIQSAAYFGSKDLALKFQQYLESSSKNYTPQELPYAFTLQAHPEFISPQGFSVNYLNILNAMEKSKRIDSATSKEAAEDAKSNFDLVKIDSLDATMSIATTLGWF